MCAKLHVNLCVCVKHFPRFRAFVQCNYAVVTCVDSFTIFPLMYIALHLTVLKLQVGNFKLEVTKYVKVTKPVRSFPYT